MEEEKTQETTDEASVSTQQTKEEAEETAKTTGRGFLVITAAKLYFMVTGAAVQLGLPILFGSAQLFGVFKLVTEAISLINMVVITGSLQAVAKLVSEEPERANSVLNQALKLQLFLGVPLALIYALGSPYIAEYAFHDASLTPFMRVSSLIILFYAFYATFVGYINGRKFFVQQAILDIVFQTMKTVGIIGLVLAGAGVMGAISGFVGAAGAICVISGIVTFRLMKRAVEKEPDAQEGGEEDAQSLEEKAAADRRRRLGRFLVVVMLYTFALNGLMRADLFMIKSIASVPPEGMGALSTMFTMVSDKFAGFYGAALNLARLPYQGVIAVTFVIFPMISEATFQQDTGRTKQYIEETFRYCLILIGGVALPLIFNADSIIAALYSADYQAGSIALAILSVGIIAFAIFYVAATVIISAGKPMVAFGLMAFSLVISAVLNWMLLNGMHAEAMNALTFSAPPAATDANSAMAALHHATAVAEHNASQAAAYVKYAPQYMRSAAIATSSAMILGCFASIFWLWGAFGAIPPWKTFVRFVIVAAILFVMDMFVPSPVEWKVEMGKIFYLAVVAGKMFVMGLVLLAVLFITREFGAQDIARARAVLGKRGKKKDEEKEEDENNEDENADQGGDA